MFKRNIKTQKRLSMGGMSMMDCKLPIIKIQRMIGMHCTCLYDLGTYATII